jgi:hypothetical protein
MVTNGSDGSESIYKHCRLSRIVFIANIAKLASLEEMGFIIATIH